MADLRTAAQQALESVREALLWHYEQGHSNTLGGVRLKIDEMALRDASAVLAALAATRHPRPNKTKNATTPLGIVCFEAYARSFVGDRRWDIAADAVREALAQAEPPREPT